MVDSDSRTVPAATRSPGRTVLVTVLALAVAAGVAWTSVRMKSGDLSAPPSGDRAPAAPSGPPASASRPSVPPASPTPGPSKATVHIPRTGPGTYARAEVTGWPGGSSGRLVTFDVRVEQSLPYSADSVARSIARTLNDRRSWRGDGSVSFRLVSGPEDADLHAYLATPGTVDRLCAPLGTHGDLSCRNGTTIAMNAERWAFAQPWFHGDVIGYRTYLVNHEFGHAIGYGHQACPGKGALAPVMMQQTKGLSGCRPNPWPHPGR